MDRAATKDVVGLAEDGAADPAMSGRKAATLAALAARGFPVPPGFVVTTAACERILATVDDAAEDLARAEFPDDVWAGIVSGLRQLLAVLSQCGHQRPRRTCLMRRTPVSTRPCCV